VDGERLLQDVKLGLNLILGFRNCRASAASDQSLFQDDHALYESMILEMMRNVEADGALEIKA